MAENTATPPVVKTKSVFSNPFVTRDVVLNTTPAQQAFDAAYDECASAMRSLSTVLPSVVKNQSELMAINGEIDHLINKGQAAIRDEIARIKKIADDNGIDLSRVNYSHPLHCTAQLTCNKAGQFLQIIVQLDELICLVHSAWFAGFIPDDAKAALERQWRRKVVAVSADVKAIANRAFRAAKKNGVDPESPEAGLELGKPASTEKSAAGKKKKSSTAETAESSVASVAAEAVA